MAAVSIAILGFLVPFVLLNLIVAMCVHKRRLGRYQPVEMTDLSDAEAAVRVERRARVPPPLLNLPPAMRAHVLASPWQLLAVPFLYYAFSAAWGIPPLIAI